MSVGYSGTPLPKKLGIRDGCSVATLGAPDGFGDTLGALPRGVAVRHDPKAGRAFDVVLAFVRTGAELSRRFQKGTRLMKVNGGLWVVWPKRTSALATMLKESDVRRHGLAGGLVDNKVCAIDADWSGLRFVVRREDRPSWRGVKPG